MEYLNMKIMTVLSLLLCSSGSVLAEPSSRVAYDRETRALIRSGDVERGKKLVKTAKCRKCHNDNGLSDDTDDPNIAGMSAAYLFKQMKDYQDESRSGKDMRKAVRKLSDQDLADLSAYYAVQSPEPAAYATQGIPILVHKGDPRRMIRACNSCHGQNGEGGMYDMPPLVGQRKGYFVTAIEEFQEDDRTNDIYSRMRNIARALTEEEIELLALYYSTPDPGE